MAYLGRKPIAEVDPTHPFARSQISFVSRPAPGSNPQSETPDSAGPTQTQEQYIQKPIDAKPKREDFASQDEFEETHAYWMSHQGRIIAVHQQSQSKDSPAK